jgi:hypothetical protein
MEDFDVKEFAKLFDAALASDNPAVKKALRNFMIVAAIATAEETQAAAKGPFSEIIDELRRLSQKVSILESQMYRTTVTSTPASPYDNGRYTGINPTWIYNPTTSVSTTSSTSSAVSVSEVDIKDLLKDLEVKWTDKI